MSKQNTPNQLIDWAVEELKQSSDSAKLDAKILLRHVTDYSNVDLILNADRQLDEQTLCSYREIIHRRKQSEPVAYLTGEKEFWSLNFKVTTDTLIPRPETELLVETALNLIPKDKILDIADLGTGSGAIACSIASERQKATIIATDQSKAALGVAQENAKTFALDNIKFIQSDWFANLADQKFDLIISNPPYVPAGDENLTKGDVRFEPDLALTPGSNGLSDLKQIIEQASCHLKPEGYLLVEHGYDQEQKVRQLFLNVQKSKETVIPVETGIQKTKGNTKPNDQPAYKNIVYLKDLNDQPRVTYAQVT